MCVHDYPHTHTHTHTQGQISIPSSMGVLPIERPCDIESGEYNKRSSLVYHYGHNSPGPNIKLYNTVVSAMADMFKKRCEKIPKGEPIENCGFSCEQCQCGVNLYTPYSLP